LILKAEIESSTPHFSFKRLVRGGFNLNLIGSTCTALPRGCEPPRQCAYATRVERWQEARLHAGGGGDSVNRVGNPAPVPAKVVRVSGQMAGVNHGVPTL